MAAYERKGSDEEKQKRLMERREKLASLLADEREYYEVICTCVKCSKRLKILMAADGVEGLLTRSVVQYERAVSTMYA